MKFWTRLSKKDRILWGSIAGILVIAIILVVWLVIRLRAQGEIISNTATVSWDDANGPHTATSNTVTTQVLAAATTINYSLQNVGSGDHSSNVTLTVYSVGGTSPLETHTVSCTNTGSGAASGSVSLGIANGSYDFRIKEPTHLSKKLNNINYSDTAAPTLNFQTISGGDLNGDNVINTADYSRLIVSWFGTGTADINRDGIVNSADFSLMVGNWFMEGG